MADVDPETLLEWLQMGQGDERDMQQIALEQVRHCKYVIFWCLPPKLHFFFASILSY